MQIPLTRGFYSQIDEADASMLIQHKWHASNERPGGVHYAVTSINRKKVYMHRLLMPEAISVDHINGDGLDNRRSNLRRANKSQNMRNMRSHDGASSCFKGVSWWSNPRLSSGGYWKAAIWDGERTIVKYAKTEHEAAMKYNEMAQRHFGKFARLNVIQEAA